ncbi:dTMP kinase [Pectinatus brassicae]|uniref:Thymidylate kinase n=1 Tax=Pectinatus brassicae TaxID=862415 RepID=A0A840UCW7_9FIRM|nr:deoxynucleoside kinase [Pectinatus brassicae]MBB5334916.1 dTMP kinase [Pectinatus brassicae]
MRGKLIIIEAGDGSGKATQTSELYNRLQKEYGNVYKVEYPDYDSESSALIKMYLRGDFGNSADSVNAYAASTFFAVDRFASYQKKWKQPYEDGAIILADRYTTSNMVHQAGKIDIEEKRNEFLDWLWDLEFVKMGLPKPDLVVFLDMPVQISDKLLEKRGSSSGNRDIHEEDSGYLHHCHDVYKQMADKYGWKTVQCARAGKIRSISDIHNDIYALVNDLLK